MELGGLWPLVEPPLPHDHDTWNVGALLLSPLTHNVRAAHIAHLASWISCNTRVKSVVYKQPKNLIYLHSIKHKSTEPEHIRMLYDIDRAELNCESLISWLFENAPNKPDALAGYERYEQENWDGYGAKPITEETRTFARKLMNLLPTKLGQPDVAPAGDGTIALEWIPDDPTHKLDKLYMDIGPGEAWTAYWRLRDGTFDTIDNEGTDLSTRVTLQHLFHSLSK